jgi:hypothetical protein
MPKYMLIYRDPAESQTPPPSPERMQGFLQLWDAWFKQFPGQVVEMGDGLLPTGRVLQPSGVVADGPYVEAKEMIGGFSVVQAQSYEEAVEVARHCPILQIGGAIEIREFAGYV